MQLGRLILAAALAWPATLLAQNAPFCVVSSTGVPSCNYYILQVCQNAAQSLRGVCVLRQNAPAAAPSVMDSFNEGYDRARRQKMEREEHEARLALLRAQTQAASTPPSSQSMVPVYRCQANGQPYLTSKDAGGCVYLGSMSTP